MMFFDVIVKDLVQKVNFTTHVSFMATTTMNDMCFDYDRYLVVADVNTASI